MGCDIHDYVEVFKSGKWEKLGKVFPDRFEKTYHNKDVLSEHPYDNRNYCLFGLLAGVRNQDIPSISPPRGVPEDASEEYKAIMNEWGCDGHSSSHFTLQELLDYPLYDFQIERRGTVSLEQYKVFKEQGSPNSWSSGYAGVNVFYLTNEEMDEYLKNPEDFLARNMEDMISKKAVEFLASYYKGTPAEKYFVSAALTFKTTGSWPEPISLYTQVSWLETIKDCVGQSWFNCLEEMKKHAPDGDFNRIRMVFFFDN